MNIGDKVRLIHSKEEGIITRFLKENVVEVEIEAGFKLPVLRRELAVVSKVEKQYFKSPADTQTTDTEIPAKRKVEIKADRGIFLAFVPLNDKDVSVYIINNSDWDLPYSLTTTSDKTHRGLLGGYLKAKSFQKSAMDLAIKDIEEWGSFTFQAFYYTYGFFVERPTFIKKMRVRPATFFGEKKKAPLIEQNAILFQLDGEEKPMDSPESKVAPVKPAQPAKSFVIDAAKIKEKMMETKVEEVLSKSFTKPSGTVDLHIEKLTNNSFSMNNSQMLELQMNTFEKQFEQAIASGMDEITFIHGVGNGVLKQEIQRKLSGNKNVAWFEDAQKEKFGYGATKIKIK